MSSHRGNRLNVILYREILLKVFDNFVMLLLTYIQTLVNILENLFNSINFQVLKLKVVLLKQLFYFLWLRIVLGLESLAQGILNEELLKKPVSF